ncbi:MAG: hypothetical protein GX030_05860 [Firmicutes bacterium]|nr:hypothetical protein [Bacillota bacterium]
MNQTKGKSEVTWYSSVAKVAFSNSGETVSASQSPYQPTRSDSRNSSGQGQSQPSFLVQAVLWAYFEACRRGLMQQEGPAPWEASAKVLPPAEQEAWEYFAAAMLDQGQGQLLHDKDQLQERALSVYSQAIDPKEQSGSSWLRRVRTLLEKL